ncbi:MAG: hypothetical protein EOP87_06450 [Verrucomicrobiaceae bacterium]|nr:MAG: hypothetical protein EOP87_06450 [Verrucomicrobiaceae bacterium]
MKRLVLWIVALISGFYAFLAGPFIPDPLPFLDEAVALAIFLKATSALGYDVRRFLPFMGKAKAAAGKKGRQPQAKDVTVDV